MPLVVSPSTRPAQERVRRTTLASDGGRKETTHAMPVAAARKLSRLHKPPDLSLEEWQRELRRQFGREQPFTLKNTGTEPAFSDFHVNNPRSGSVYRVAIRGSGPGDNYCSCPDFATNSLGTCKHVEFVLRKLEARPRTRALLRRGFQPPYS